MADPLASIRATFRETFADWEIELPKSVEPKGQIFDGGWSIGYVLHETDGQPSLEYLAEHRMTNMQHSRILANGDVIGLGTFMDSIGFDPEVDADEAAARERYDAHNRRVTEQLRSVGLI
ncbi:MAG: hypothetical protein ACI83Y_002457 [Candidatus Azotimanducaceae bacterium]|jgi:hypothetical protein